MKKILVLFAIVLGLTGCSMNVAPVIEAPVIEEEKSNIEWVSNIESRAAETTLDEVTIEVYRVPGEKLRVKTFKDYNYEYYSCIRVVEFDSYSLFCNEEDEIHLFDYDDTVGMEVSLNWGGPLRTKNKVKHNEWRFLSDRILHRDDEVGYEDYFYFLKKVL